MKKLWIILMATGLALSVSAQKSRYGGRPYYGRSRVVISSGVYSPYFSYGYGYPFYSYPYDYYYGGRPTKLELKIEDIKNDYGDKIWSARHDKSLPGKERRKNVHLLKHERDQAIIQAKRDYYKMK